MITFALKDRTACLVFDMTSWEEMEETIGSTDDIDELMDGRERLKNRRRLLSLLAREGARLGKGDPMPEDWLKENLPPARARDVISAIRDSLKEGFRSDETEQDTDADGNHVVDKVLQQLEKKDEPDA